MLSTTANRTATSRVTPHFLAQLVTDEEVLPRVSFTTITRQLRQQTKQTIIPTSSSNHHFKIRLNSKLFDKRKKIRMSGKGSKSKQLNKIKEDFQDSVVHYDCDMKNLQKNREDNYYVKV